MKMKSMSEIAEFTAASRETMLKTTVTTAKTSKKIVAKILTVAGEKGDYVEGGMNAYSSRVTGIELRREMQGTYECVNVLQAIRKGTLPMDENEFDKCPIFGCIRLSSLMKNKPELVGDALAIIRAGVDVTKLLNALGKAPKKPPVEPPVEPEGEQLPPPPVEIVIQDADVFTIPHDCFALSHESLIERILGEIECAEPEDLTVMSNIMASIAVKMGERNNAFANAAKPVLAKVA